MGIVVTGDIIISIAQEECAQYSIEQKTIAILPLFKWYTEEEEEVS